jgi:hypothetical protein
MSPAARSRRVLLWGVIALLWGCFFGWYTSCSGPLGHEEIDHYVAIMQERGQPAERIASIREFLENDTGDDFVMVNAIELNAAPGPVPGMPVGASASEILDGYMAYMWPALLSRACHPIFFGASAGRSVEQLGIDGAADWSRAALMRYRSRRDMMEIATHPEFADAHVFKVAAMAKTFAFPVDPWLQLGDPRLVLLLLLVVVGLLLERFGVV